MHLGQSIVYTVSWNVLFYLNIHININSLTAGDFSTPLYPSGKPLNSTKEKKTSIRIKYYHISNRPNRYLQQKQNNKKIQMLLSRMWKLFLNRPHAGTQKSLQIQKTEISLYNPMLYLTTIL